MRPSDDSRQRDAAREHSLSPPLFPPRQLFFFSLVHVRCLSRVELYAGTRPHAANYRLSLHTVARPTPHLVQFYCLLAVCVAAKTQQKRSRFAFEKVAKKMRVTRNYSPRTTAEAKPRAVDAPSWLSLLANRSTDTVSTPVHPSQNKSCKVNTLIAIPRMIPRIFLWGYLNVCTGASFPIPSRGCYCSGRLRKSFGSYHVCTFATRQTGVDDASTTSTRPFFCAPLGSVRSSRSFIVYDTASPGDLYRRTEHAPSSKTLELRNPISKYSIHLKHTLDMPGKKLYTKTYTMRFVSPQKNRNSSLAQRMFSERILHQPSVPQMLSFPSMRDGNGVLSTLQAPPSQ